MQCIADLFQSAEFFQPSRKLGTTVARKLLALGEVQIQNAKCRLFKAGIFANSEIFYWSGRRDSNSRPPVPKTGALPDCATPRSVGAVYNQERRLKSPKIAHIKNSWAGASFAGPNCISLIKRSVPNLAAFGDSQLASQPTIHF